MNVFEIKEEDRRITQVLVEILNLASNLNNDQITFAYFQDQGRIKIKSLGLNLPENVFKQMMLDSYKDGFKAATESLLAANQSVQQTKIK